MCLKTIFAFRVLRLKNLLPSLFLGVASMACASTSVPAGNGVTDDTAAIQALLDTQASVYLPPPPKHYVISKALRLHSGQTLRLDPGTTIRLAPGANDYMLINADTGTGNRHITLSGGIWDGNNTANNQLKGPRTRPWPDFFIGSAIVFTNVIHLRVEKLTIKDPVRFGLHIGACRKFTIEDITFDYNMRSPSMDGVHLQGGCREGRVANIRGNTSDDMVALNSDDMDYYEITRGPISDIQIDGLWATDCFRAVRFLTVGTPISRVGIANIHGSYQRNVVAFTHWKKVPAGNVARIEDISISNIFSAKVTSREALREPRRHDDMRRTFALIGAEGYLQLDNISISGLHRREWMPGAAPTIHFQRGSSIGTLRLRDISHINMTAKPIPFLRHDASITRLYVDNVLIREKEGTDLPQLITGSGRILAQHGEVQIESAEMFDGETARVDNETKANPPRELRL